MYPNGIKGGLDNFLDKIKSIRLENLEEKISSYIEKVKDNFGTYKGIILNSIYNLSSFSRIGNLMREQAEMLEEQIERLHKHGLISDKEYKSYRRKLGIAEASSKALIIVGIVSTLLGIGGYFLLHDIYSQPPGEHLDIDSSYAALIPTANGKVEVVVYQNGQLKDLGTYNGIVYNNQSLPPYVNPVSNIQDLQQFDQQVVPQNPNYQYLNWSIILYFPNGQGTLPITNNGYIDLSNISPGTNMALIATTNQYLIPLDEAILSQQGKLYIISANGAQYLEYNYPNIEEIDRETMDLQAYVNPEAADWGGGDLCIVNTINGTELIPIAGTPTTIPALRAVGAYNGSS